MSFSASSLPKPAGRRPALLVAFHWITVLALEEAVTLVLGREAVDEKALRALLLNLHEGNQPSISFERSHQKLNQNL